MKLICWFCKKPIKSEAVYVFLDCAARVKRFSCSNAGHEGVALNCSYCAETKDEIRSIKENPKKYTCQHVIKD